jgi:hypothetical protein
MRRSTACAPRTLITIGAPNETDRHRIAFRFDRSPRRMDAIGLEAMDTSVAIHSGDIERRLLDLSSERIALMDETGLDVQVLSLTTPALHDLGPESVGVARRANDVLGGASGITPKPAKRDHLKTGQRDGERDLRDPLIFQRRRGDPCRGVSVVVNRRRWQHCGPP